MGWIHAQRRHCHGQELFYEFSVPSPRVCHWHQALRIRMRISREVAIFEHEFAQLPFNVTCPTGEFAKIAMLSGTPIRFCQSGIWFAFQDVPRPSPRGSPFCRFDWLCR